MLKKEDVKHIADLARLELSEKEINKITPQLSDIIGYIEQLSEVDTTDVAPTAQVTGQTNVFRSDEANDWPADGKALALEQAPKGLEGNQIKVKKVL